MRKDDLKGSNGFQWLKVGWSDRKHGRSSFSRTKKKILKRKWQDDDWPPLGALTCLVPLLKVIISQQKCMSQWMALKVRNAEWFEWGEPWGFQPPRSSFWRCAPPTSTIGNCVWGGGGGRGGTWGRLKFQQLARSLSNPESRWTRKTHWNERLCNGPSYEARCFTILCGI